MRRRLACNAAQLIALLSFSASMLMAEDEISLPTTPVVPSLTVQTCTACHGPAGNSLSSAIPSIAGLPREYLRGVMGDYRHGGRFSTVMGRLVQAYNDEQMDLLADYFSRQSFKLHKQRVDWDQASKGRQLHRLYCRQCHGDLSRAPEPGSPVLNGRWMDYLRWTLQDYLLGVSQADEEMSGALTRLVRRHGEQGLEALVHYYGSARPKSKSSE
ncbi:MAG: hypothetical protein KZQ65_01800 [Candidatus Thiodiazotropha sp. (ex Gloverina cf. vestifex)]|nr:hypothetical protein [Candidatus Thiodiazotropha sp. (ex Gloverina cf. vestifex)]